MGLFGRSFLKTNQSLDLYCAIPQLCSWRSTLLHKLQPNPFKLILNYFLNKLHKGYFLGYLWNFTVSRWEILKSRICGKQQNETNVKSGTQEVLRTAYMHIEHFSCQVVWVQFVVIWCTLQNFRWLLRFSKVSFSFNLTFNRKYGNWGDTGYYISWQWAKFL